MQAEITPKTLLLELANENPGAVLSAIVVNGQIRTSFQFANSAQLLEMLFVLQEAVRMTVKEKMGLTTPVPQHPV